ncbi:MAG: hypothetical protein KBB14_17560, partial [Thermoanaerobaculia bacterium]|nr:hypothetical protein [Thermoanaerobaculia bacterium]
MLPHLLLAPPAAAGLSEPFPGFPSRLQLPAELLVPGASAVAIATLGLVALLFWARDRSRTDLLLYTILASGLSTFLVLGLRSGATGASRAALGLLLPGLAWLLLVRFL